MPNISQKTETIVDNLKNNGKIYYQPNNTRKKELEYFETVRKYFPNFRHINENYIISEKLLSNLVSNKALIENLTNDRKLPARRKNLCIDELKKLPDALKVALKPIGISFDFVITNNDDILFIEFHENQHSKLKDKGKKQGVHKLSKVYDENANVHLVPRYVQRLIRDVWRIKNFKCFNVVWWDWYEQNKENHKLCFTEEFKEYHKANKFSFTNFINNK